jgi:hypothetical protein
VTQRCLYDNPKVVVLGRDEQRRPVWSSRFLDFALRVGFDILLCQPYRAQTKGKVESGVKYVKGNFWPGVRFTDLGDLNRQAQAWTVGVADVRVHGTTRERPQDRLVQERVALQPLPGPDRPLPFLGEERKVGRDGYIQWEGAWYGVAWPWAGQRVRVQAREGTVELWAGGEQQQEGLLDTLCPLWYATSMDRHKSSTVIPVRLPNEVAELLRLRAERKKVSLGLYIRDLVVAEAMRDRNAPKTRRKAELANTPREVEQ